jgi:hypothetical protein
MKSAVHPFRSSMQESLRGIAIVKKCKTLELATAGDYFESKKQTYES